MQVARPKVWKDENKQRLGKGFSREELKKTGSCLAEALKLKIPIDPRRKTAHDENAEALKAILESKRAHLNPTKEKNAKSCALN